MSALPAELSFQNPRGYQVQGELLQEFERGLMMGLKFADPRGGPWMTAAGFQSGILTIFANNDPSVIQILPPLIIERDEAQQVLNLLDGMISGLELAMP